MTTDREGERETWKESKVAFHLPLYQSIESHLRVMFEQMQEGKKKRREGGGESSNERCSARGENKESEANNTKNSGKENQWQIKN